MKRKHHKTKFSKRWKAQKPEALSIEPRACTFIKIFGSGMVPTTFDRSWEDAPWFSIVYLDPE